MAERKRGVATENEVLRYLTQTMRDETAKDAFRAAELLGKHFGLFTDTGRGEAEHVTIVDDMGK